MFNGLYSAVNKIIDRKTRSVCAVIVAAGASSRMKGIDKIFAILDDRPVISYSIAAFQESTLIKEIVIVCAKENVSKMQELCKEYNYTKVKACVSGGATRAESSNIGVTAAGRKHDIFVIHDGARPFITQSMIKESILAAEKYGAATVAIPATSTIKKVKDGFVTETPDRSELYEIQTPQSFKYAIIKAGLKNVFDKGIEITDDCMAVESIGVKPKIVEGSRNNIKITVQDDLVIANSILENRSNLQ